MSRAAITAAISSAIARGIVPARQRMGDELHLLSRRDGTKSDQGALRAQLERLVDEVVVAG